MPSAEVVPETGPPADKLANEWRWLALIWLLLGVALAVVLWLAHGRVQGEQGDILQRQAAILRDNLAQQFTVIGRGLDGVVQAQPLRQAQEAGREHLAQQLRLQQLSMLGVRRLDVVDAQGHSVASSDVQPFAADAGQAPWLASVRALGAAARSTLVVGDAAADGGGLVLARALAAPDGAFTGAVVATLDLQPLDDLFGTVRVHPDTLAGLALNERVIVRQKSAGGAAADRAVQALDQLLTQQGGGPASVPVFEGAPGPDQPALLAALRTVQPPVLQLSQPLRVGVAREARDVYAGWRALALTLLGIYMVLGTVAVEGLMLLLRRKAELAARMGALQERTQELEGRWLAVLAANDLGIWDWDERAQQMYYSPTFKRMLGYAEEDFGSGLTEWSSRLHPDESIAVLERVRAFFRSHGEGVFESVHRMRRKDDRYQWVEVRGRAMERDADGRFGRFVGVQADVTARQEAQALVDRLVSHVPGVLFQLHMAADGFVRFPYLSRGSRAVLGFGPDDLRQDGTPLFARVPAHDALALRQGIEASARTLNPWEQQFRLHLPGRGERWMHGMSRPDRQADGTVLWHGYLYDITEQHELQERLDRIAANVPGMLYQFEMESDGRGRFPYAGEGARFILELSPVEMQGSADAVFARLHPDDLQSCILSIQESARTLSVWEQEYRVVLPERGERWLKGQARPYRLDDGAVRWDGYLYDMTETKLQTLQLAETERVLRHLLDDLPIGLCLIDEHKRLYFRNRHFYDYFGRTAEPPTQRDWALQTYPDPIYREEVRARWQRALAQAHEHDGEIVAEEYSIRTHDGSTRVVAIAGLLFGQHLLITFVDQTEQQAQNEFLRKLAYMDTLTGVANRREFDDRLINEWSRCTRSGLSVALLMIDVDDFKRYNDRYGHQAGDQCLQAVAQALASVVGRAHDLLARYGGEEFVCLLPDSDLDGARSVALNMMAAVRALKLEHKDARAAAFVTVSVGAACLVPGPGQPPKDVVAQADAHLYRAKELGRNGVFDGIGLLQKK